MSHENQSHLRGIYDEITDIEKLIKLSNFFFKLLGYLKTLLFERVRGNPNFVRFSQFWSVVKDDSSLVNLMRHGEWSESTLLVIDFALLRQRLGNSILVNSLDFDEIHDACAQKIEFAIDFIKVVLERKVYFLESKMVMNAEEEQGFLHFPVSLKELLRQSYDCTIEVFKPNPDELVGNKGIMLQYVIDGIIASYRL